MIQVAAIGSQTQKIRLVVSGAWGRGRDWGLAEGGGHAAFRSPSASRSTSRASASATAKPSRVGRTPTAFRVLEPHEAAGPPIPEERPIRLQNRLSIAGGEIPEGEAVRHAEAQKTVLRAHARPDRAPPARRWGCLRGGLRPPSLRRLAGSRTVPPAPARRNGRMARHRGTPPRSSTSGCGGIETRGAAAKLHAS